MGAVQDVQGGGCRALTLQHQKILQEAKPALAAKLWQFELFSAHLPQQPPLFCGCSREGGFQWCWELLGRVMGQAGHCSEVWQKKSCRILQAAQPVCSWGVQPGDLPNTPGIQ